MTMNTDVLSLDRKRPKVEISQDLLTLMFRANIWFIIWEKPAHLCHLSIQSREKNVYRTGITEMG